MSTNLSSIGISYIEALIEDGTIELVSYGLAPNPFGFCYEHISGTVDDRKISRLLDGLTREESLYLIKNYIS